MLSSCRQVCSDRKSECLISPHRCTPSSISLSLHLCSAHSLPPSRLDQPPSLLPFVSPSFTRQKRETDLQEMPKAAACKHPSGFHSDAVSLDLVSVDVVGLRWKTFVHLMLFEFISHRPPCGQELLEVLACERQEPVGCGPWRQSVKILFIIHQLLF